MQKDFSYLNQLVSYIKKNLKKGYTEESLKWALVNQGHSKPQIEKALKRVEQELAREAPILKTKPKITYEIIEPKTNTSVEIENKKSFWDKLFG